ncbi:TPA: hypothetical protein HA278_02670 [Candidatus Woesearchaeota archaeon]|nr:hypothetical protein [archaeon]HIJ10938.1 hypothetical protein [Candidatus Woesearchaeota archaeon]|tara:strand:+ start:189 stop:767 length:579 start_codon:yes stop_codon:yes gene_type:complete
MSDPIMFIPRMVEPKGINKQAIPNRDKIREYCFDDEHDVRVEEQPLIIEHPLLLYPGSGCDIFHPLLHVEQLFPSLQKITFHFIDQDNYLAMIKTMLDDVGVHFAQDKQQLQFWWHDLFVTLHFQIANAFSLTLPKHHIYFEKSFTIMKEEFCPEFDERVLDALHEKGIIISDSDHSETFHTKREGKKIQFI